jgi:hypothetical protein
LEGFPVYVIPRIFSGNDASASQIRGSAGKRKQGVNHG